MGRGFEAEETQETQDTQGKKAKKSKQKRKEKQSQQRGGQAAPDVEPTQTQPTLEQSQATNPTQDPRGKGRKRSSTELGPPEEDSESEFIIHEPPEDEPAESTGRRRHWESGSESDIQDITDAQSQPKPKRGRFKPAAKPPAKPAATLEEQLKEAIAATGQQQQQQ